MNAPASKISAALASAPGVGSPIMSVSVVWMLSLATPNEVSSGHGATTWYRRTTTPSSNEVASTSVRARSVVS
jgi:hypothetical protein